MDKNDIKKSIEENGWNHVTIAQLEGIEIQQITDIETRYKNLNTLAAIDEQFKIPLLSHHIWLTRQASPTEIREQDLKVLDKTLSILDINKSNWLHILWTNCKACIPKSVEKLKFKNILVIEINNIEDTLSSYDIVLALIERKLFGIAADLLRFDILKNFGGFYCDLNYMVMHSPEQYMKTFDLMVHTADKGVFVDIFMILTKPHHPILEEVVDTVLRNIINPPYYISLAQNSSISIKEYTALMTFLPFNLAFFKHVNQDTVDFAFPLEMKGGYPKEVIHEYISSNHEETGLFNTCKISDKPFEEYNNKEICVEKILGLDSWDGDTWV